LLQRGVEIFQGVPTAVRAFRVAAYDDPAMVKVLECNPVYKRSVFPPSPVMINSNR
jgi:hypothetical protein